MSLTRFSAAALFVAATHSVAQDTAAQETTGQETSARDTSARETSEIIEVIGQTPLGAEIDGDRIAANVQSATAEDLRKQRALDLADYMRRNLTSVFVNEAQSNPLQPDLQYRGFVGSPLLGLPQGLAVYQDGVRVNEPFGDTVNWALIPDSAIETLYLMPGSNPLFGLNALGGAIALQTRDGFSSPGTRAEAYGGSFGRVGLQAETGGSPNEGFGYFVTGSYFEEDGWRDFSPTEALQLFSGLGWRTGQTQLDLKLTLADTDLIGNGAAPVSLLALDRKQIFTRPDQTENDLALANLVAEHRFSDSLLVTGNVYLRNSDIGTYNGDDSDFAECEANPGLICEEEDDGEELVFDEDGQPIPASAALAGATVNRTSTGQNGMGLGLQAAWTGQLGGRENFLTAGFAYDDADIDFAASTELGQLDATREAIPGGVFVGESFTSLGAQTSTLGIYVTNTVVLSDSIALTISGRYNDTEVELRDRLGVALNGDHSFDRFNPAIGLTADLSEAVSAYARYSESSRAPSPVELTCADEDDPCRLPNAFLADPPLEQIVAETFEAGVRGETAGVDWHAGLFRTTNRDDILFISAGALTNEGFFDNVGRTRRDGVELDLSGEVLDGVSWFVGYTYLDATFRESLAFPSPNNPAAVGGEAMVSPGDRLPLVPRHLAKAGVSATIGDRLTLAGDLAAGGNFHMRGDEGNDLAKVGNYTVVSVRAAYELRDDLRVFLDIDNVFDEEYETFGLFGEPDEVLGEDFEDSRFFSPGAPRAAWVGIQAEF